MTLHLYFATLKNISYFIGFLITNGTSFLVGYVAVNLVTLILQMPHGTDKLGQGIGYLYIIFFSVFLILALIELAFTAGLLYGLLKNKANYLFGFVLYSAFFYLLVIIGIYLYTVSVIITSLCFTVVCIAMSVIWVTFNRMGEAEGNTPVCTDT